MEIGQYIAALRQEGVLLADTAERAGLDAVVPSCPPWQVRDLLRHISYVHRWAASFVAERRTEPWPDRPTERELLNGGPPDAELISWFRAGHAALVQTLSTADPALVCWTVLPGPSSVLAWARRQAHETGMHRVDAELAAGRVTPFPADFAADGIDELIMSFLGRDATATPGATATTPEQQSDQHRENPHQVLQVLASDGSASAGAWLVELTADGSRAARVSRGTGPADCTLSGPASALCQLLWNRCDPAADGITVSGITVSGDASILRAWRDGMHVRWA
ncbi:MAG: maleylpyruvate isomerase family mycothiol-dependent enzyme [Streptosporangiaceae bacterium]|jgi:uncharacterized protein (TIGR03083 family)